MCFKIKKIWNDPVWSKVIAGIILFVLNGVWLLIKGLIDKQGSLNDLISFVFSYKINIWLAIALFIFISILYSSIVRVFNKNVTNNEVTNNETTSKEAKNKTNNHPPIVPFAKDFTSGVYLNYPWSWNWAWSETGNFYIIKDLQMMCPNCQKGILTESDDGYRCVKCNRSISFYEVSTALDRNVVEQQILLEARRKYPNYINYLGSFKGWGGLKHKHKHFRRRRECLRNNRCRSPAIDAG